MPELLVPPAIARRWLWLVAGVGLIVYCYHFSPIGPGERLYVAAARCMLERLPLQQCDRFFTYPPVAALMMMPLAPLPALLINTAWYILTLGALTGCFRFSVTLVQGAIPATWSDKDLVWLYLIGIVLCLKFLFAAAGNQSYDAIVVLLALIGLYGLTGDRPAWAGVAFGAAAALKATPLVFLPYLLFTRRFTAAIVMTVAGAGFSLLPDLFFSQSLSHGYFATWVGNVAAPAWTEHLEDLPHIFWSGGPGNNYSLRGLLGFFMEDGNVTFRVAIDVIYAVYAAVVAAIVLRSYRRPWSVASDGALLLLSMLLMSPMTSLTHFSALILFFVLLAAVWLKDAELRPVAGFFIAVIFVTTNLTSDDLVGKGVGTWVHHYRIMTLGMLSLVIFSAIYADRRARREAMRQAPGPPSLKPG